MIPAMAAIKKTLAILAEQTTNADGSITVRPIAVADGREIGTGEAAKLLGLKDRETVSRLCSIGATLGGLRAWQMPSARGNAKWRISLQSVLDFKERRINAMKGNY